MSNKINGNVLIVGAGPTGLTLANSLYELGIPCRIIDKLEAPTQLSKAAGIHARTLEVFSSLGIVNEFIEKGHKIHTVSMYANHQRIAHIDYTKVDSPFPFAIMLPQVKTEAVLTETLQKRGVSINHGVELIHFEQNEEGVTTTLKHLDGHEERFKSSFLVGCDGAHSATRQNLNFQFSGETMFEDWILADVDSQWDGADDQIHIFMSEKGLFVIFPFGNDRFRIAANYRSDPKQNGKEPTVDEFQLLANEHLSQKMEFGGSHWLSTFKINYRKVSQYRSGRVFLAGDAAHIHSPAGGQGMNTGIQDAYNLAWKLSLVLKNHVSLSFLDSYYDERSPVAEDVLKETKNLTQMVTLKNSILVNLRNFILPKVSKLNLFQKHFVARMAEVAVTYRRSPIVSEKWSYPFLKHGLSAGDRAPDCILWDNNENCIRSFFKIFDYKKHHILLFIKKTDKSDDFLTFANKLASEYNDLVNLIFIYPKDSQVSVTFENAVHLLDTNNICFPLYQIEKNALYFIRPDGYIGYRCQPLDVESFFLYLHHIFAPLSLSSAG